MDRLGQNDEAKGILREALKEKPGHKRCVRQLAHLWHKEGRMAEALELLDRSLSGTQSDGDWRLRYERAAIYRKLGEAEKAMEDLLRAKEQLADRASQDFPTWSALAERQWQCTQLLTMERLRRWSQGPCEGQQVCLMSGFPRSGTTLLEKILESHQELNGRWLLEKNRR